MGSPLLFYGLTRETHHGLRRPFVEHFLTAVPHPRDMLCPFSGS